MAIMAMGMAKVFNKNTIGVLVLLISNLSYAGEWKFSPNLGLDETYTDNVELTTLDPTASFVTQVIAGLDADYKSRMAELTLTGTKSYALYSHDSDLNDDYRTLGAKGSYSLWTNGPSLIGSASINNVSRNSADNSLADLVSGDTVESENYSLGLQQNFGNSDYSLQSSLSYSITRAEDGIGESDGFSALINGNNGNTARYMFWQLDGNYSKREQNYIGGTNDGENYSIEASIGAITTFNLNPFIRIYNEDVKGTAAGQNTNNTSSWGPGLRWLASSHLIFDVSYNFVEDKTKSDDYIAAKINWEPSQRTSLNAGFSQRFFGDSYDVDFSHRTKRLTNTISYHETLEAFDRGNYQETDLGNYWCPTSGFTGDISQCFPESQPPSDTSGYQLTPFSGIELVQSTEFSLNKRFSLVSTLQLSRTSFTLNVSMGEREGLESKIVDDNLNANLTITRTLSPKSDVSISGNFKHLLFDKHNPNGSGQEDYYRTISTNYTRNLASSLSSNFTLQYVDRTSTIDRYSYDEIRAMINITKDF